MHGMRSRSGTVLLSTFLALSLTAQSEEDALRISSYQPGGTARSAGLGNAFGALGADAAAVVINPGGGGLYRSSEVSLTPLVEVNKAMSSYYGTQAKDSHTRFAFSSLALAINSPSDKKGYWRSGTFGIVFDRQESHYWDRQAIAGSAPTTILQSFVNEADGTMSSDLNTFFPFTSGLAWLTYGIDPAVFLDPNGDTLPNRYESAIPFGSPVQQTHTIVSTGASNNTAFFYAGNFMDRLYIGASLGIAGHRYVRTTTHAEVSADYTLDLGNLSYREELNASGSGFDVKLGIVGRITERFRMGLAYHSPQWMQMTESFSTSLRTGFRTPDVAGNFIYEENSPLGESPYRVNTPWRTVLSAAYVAGAYGLFSVDYTYADYTRMSMKASDLELTGYDFAAENELIQGTFRRVHSVRVGTEWRQGRWYYRLGWGYVPDAYQRDDKRHTLATKTYAGGIGYRTDHIGLDLGLNYVQSQFIYYQYDPSTVQATVEDRSTFRTLLTLSFRP